MNKLALTLSAVIMAATGPGAAFASGGHQQAPYAGQQTRTIKSLSASDIEALQEGRGWGFAKSAELNGYPGPLHVLELDEKLDLTSAQREQIKAIFADMKAAAQKTGREFLEAEQALDAIFTSGKATPEKVSELTQAAARLRAELRSIHLRAHLLTTPLLSKAQLHRYATLRGYAGDGGDHEARKGSHKGSHSGHK